MEKMVSKVRAKKTKKRQKQAEKASGRGPLLRHGVVGLLIAFLLWVLSLLIAHSDSILYPNMTVPFVMSVAGEGAFLLTALFIAGIGFLIIRPQTIHNNSHLLLLAIIAIITLIPAKALIFAADSTSLPFFKVTAPFFLPLAMPSLLATVLLGARVGLITGLWTSLAMTILCGWNPAILLAGLIATVVASHLVRNARTRTRIAQTGLLVGLCEMVILLGVTAITWKEASARDVLWQAGACMASGIACGLLTLIMLPLFEALFRITTNITLLELSDLGHPLLQRLAIEAPGTYHHSLVVANLAAAAAEEIGANALLARVASYFHDVGKLTKPSFFAENIQRQTNPHDDLPPSMSTLVITSHVKEGLSLGMLHKLPRPILNVIREHHGTGLLSYFHHKAASQMELELGKQDGPQAGGKPQIDETAFRYSGPKTSSKESAIIALADAVEAASRSMEKTSPGHIEGLVTEIIYTRFEDGQLDNCDLKMSDLRRVKASFVFTLTNMLHGRVPYPKDENRSKQQANSSPHEQGENTTTDKPSNGEGRRPR